MAETEVEILNIDTSKSTRSIKELRQEIKDLKDQLVNLDRGTEAYNQTLLKLGNKTHELSEIQEEIARTTSDFGDKLSNVRGVIGGISGAFQTVLGSLSLMGVQIGDDVKMLKMLQSAMAITQGIAAIDAGVKSFKALTVAIKASTVAASGLKKALVTTGIGALVVGLGLLISKLTEAGDEADEMSQRMVFDIENVRNSLYGTESQMNRVIKLMRAFGSTEKEIEDYRIQRLADYINELRNARDEAIALYEAAVDAVRKAEYLTVVDSINTELASMENNLQEMMADAYAESAIRFKEAEEKKLEAARERARRAAEIRRRDLQEIQQYNKLALESSMSKEMVELNNLRSEYETKIALFKKYGADTTLIEEQYLRDVKSIRARYNKEWQDEVDAKMQAVKDAIDEESSAVMKGLEGQISTLEYFYKDAYIAHQKELAKMTENNDGETDLFSLEQYYNDKAIEKMEEKMDEAYMKLLEKKIELTNELLFGEGSVKLNTEDRETLLSQYYALEAEKAEKSVEIEQKALERRKKLYENYRKAISTITSSVSSILGSIGETLEQGGEDWKNVKIAEAIISTIQGSIAAYMGMIESIPGPWGIAAGAAAAASTAMAGYAEVERIRNTKISTSGSSESSGTSLGSVRPQAVQVAATQVTNTRQTPTTQDVEELPAQQVYVLEGDISRAQNNVRVTVEQATH